VALQITLAGDVTIRRTGDEPRRLGGAQARVAFALLTLERQRGVTRDELADAVWPDALPATWESALRTVVSKVRAFVAPDTTAGSGGSGASGGSGDDAGGPIVAHGGRYLLHLPDDTSVDVEQADAEVAAAAAALAAGDVALAREQAQSAVDRLRPAFLSDHDGEWVATQREHRAAQLVTALELLGQAASRAGDHAAALAAATDAVAEAPLRESAHRCRMAVHAAAGNRAQALRAYQQLRTMLIEELGVDPSPETEAAYLALLGSELPAPAAGPGWTGTEGGGGPGPGAVLPAGTPPPFVGRGPELAEIRGAWAAALAGTPRLVLVTGDDGVGKTRLAGEAARRIAAEGALVLLGRCDPSHGVPYQPLVELLDGFLYALPRDWTREFRPKVREALAAVFPAVADAEGGPGAGEAGAAGGGKGGGVVGVVLDRAELFDAVTEILVDAAGDRPVLIVLDDAPAADDDSLALLRHLVRHVAPAPLLVLVMARSRLPHGHPFADTVRALERDGLLQRLPLAGLGEADVRRLLDQLRPDDTAEARARFARSLVADTSGNPQMLVELLRDLDDIAARAVPPGVQGLVERKLDELGPAAHDLLRAAAVAAVGAAGGPDFELDVVEHALGLDHLAVLDALDEALVNGLVSEVGSGYRFTQEITRRTLYERLSEPRRRHLHGRLADAVEARRADRLDAHTVALAEHRRAAAGPRGDRRAVAWLLAAAAQARADRAPADVVRWCESALDHAPDDDPALRAEVLVDLGLALASVPAGEGRAEAVLLDAALQAQRAGRPGLAAEAALGLADLARTRPALRPEATALVEDLLLVGSIADEPEVVTARLLARHVELLPDDAGAALTSVDRHQLAARAVAALYTRLDALAGPADAVERTALAADLAALGGLLVDDRAVAAAAHHRAMVAAVAGDGKTADQVLDAGGDQAMRAQRAVVVAVTQGDFATAAELTGNVEVGSAARATRRQMLVARWLQGRLGDDATDVDTDDPADRVLVALARGHRGQARLLLLSLAADADQLPGGDGRLHSLGVLALAAFDNGDPAAADTVRGLLAPHADLACADGYRSFVGTAGFHLGRLALVGGDLADAERYLMPALSRHAEMQARPWVALTQHALADVLDARGRSSDRDWVTALRSEARWLANSLSLRPL
jgi:DNA-binding SARP family transcriptional activator